MNQQLEVDMSFSEMLKNMFDVSWMSQNEFITICAAAEMYADGRAKHFVNWLTQEKSPYAVMYDDGDGTLEEALSLINDSHNFLIKDRSQRDTFNLKPIQAAKYKLGPAPWHFDMIRHTQMMFIDDNAYGMPLKPAVMSKSRMVDWDEVDKQLEQNGFYQTVLQS